MRAVGRNVILLVLLGGLLAGCVAVPFTAPSEEELYFPFPVSDDVAKKWRRQVVSYVSEEQPGTIVVDTEQRFLYLVMRDDKAVRYGVAVGKQGFSWKGEATILRKAEWPTWTPPREMIARRPELQRYASGMDGSPINPLGSRALYLYQDNVDTLYRLHGAGEPWTIGRAVSSGCVRLLNDDIADLYERVPIGTKVVVL